MADNTPKKKAAFLKCLENGDSIQNAANVAGIARNTAYVWRKKDEEFAALWDEALDAGIDRLEDAAFERAMNGSDTLIIFLLKSKRPKVYSDKQRLEHTGAEGAPLGLTVNFVSPED